MKMEVSNNMLAVLAVVAIAVSLAGTTTMVSLVPTEPSAITGMAQTQETGTALAEVQPEASIILLVSTVDFKTISPASSNDTVDLSPWPFVVENNGSVEVNISVGVIGDNLWDSAWNDGNFTYNGSKSNESDSTYVWIQSAWTSMINTSGGETLLVYNLTEINCCDEVRNHLRIIVPGGESSGQKSCSVRFNASIG